MDTLRRYYTMNQLLFFLFQVKELVSNIIENMIKEAKKKESQSNSQPKLPLIRLRVVYRDESQVFNAIRFGQQYSNRVRSNSLKFQCEFYRYFWFFIRRLRIQEKCCTCNVTSNVSKSKKSRSMKRPWKMHSLRE